MKLFKWSLDLGFWNILRKILHTTKYGKSEFEKCGKHQNMFSDHWHKTKKLCKICHNISRMGRGQSTSCASENKLYLNPLEISYRMCRGNSSKLKAMLKN